MIISLGPVQMVLPPTVQAATNVRIWERKAGNGEEDITVCFNGGGDGRGDGEEAYNRATTASRVEACGVESERDRQVT